MLACVEGGGCNGEILPKQVLEERAMRVFRIKNKNMASAATGAVGGAILGGYGLCSDMLVVIWILKVSLLV